jgi:DNA polymerase V
MESALDINALLIRRPSATFFCRAQGDSMKDAGIHDGDLLVVDRSLAPQPGDVVVATLDGGLVVKRLTKIDDRWMLASANPDYPALAINPEEGVTIFGVVAHAVTSFCQR